MVVTGHNQIEPGGLFCMGSLSLGLEELVLLFVQYRKVGMWLVFKLSFQALIPFFGGANPSTYFQP